MATPTWIKRMLEKRGVPFEEHTHADAWTAQRMAQAEHFSGHRVAKVVVVLADGRPVELVMPATRRVDLDRVREILGAAEVRFASEREMEQMFPGCEVGAIPPLDAWPGVPVLMDVTMAVEGDILFQAGTHHDAVKVRFAHWYQAVQPRVGEFTVAMPEREPAGT